MKRIFIILSILTVVAASCIKDRVSPASNVVIDPGTRVLLHYWNFNSSTNLLSVNFTADTAITDTPKIVIPPSTAVPDAYDQYTPGTVFNAKLTDTGVIGGALRVRNPSTYMILNIPTTGYKSPILTIAAMRSNSGAQTSTVSYTTDGINYSSLIGAGIDLTAAADTTWISTNVFSYDFTGLAGVDNNPKFAVKISFVGVSSATSGNDRFDNITVNAYKN
ncbi:MAG: hypothetical protein WCG87_05645 [Bacteroidota bacterium]